jgi:hypothetical protein
MMPANAANLQLVGKFAFNTKADPSKTTCTKVTAHIASQLKCQSTGLSSGKTALLCSTAGGADGYLIFDTKNACDSERNDESAAE